MAINTDPNLNIDWQQQYHAPDEGTTERGFYGNVYNYDPNHFGHYSYNNGQTVWNPSKIDLSNSGLTYVGDGKFSDAGGFNFWYDPRTDTISNPVGEETTSYLDNKQQYYNTLGKSLTDEMFSNWSYNQDDKNQALEAKLENLKASSPQAYYAAKLDYFGSKMGWNAAQNTGEKNTEYQKAIEQMMPDMQNAGISNEQINSIINNSYATASQKNMEHIANQKAGSTYLTPSDIITISAILGGSALAAWAAPAVGSIGAEAPLSTTELLSTGGFTPVNGASFTIDPLAAYTTGAAATEASPFTTTELLNTSGFTPTESGGFTIDPNVAYTTGNPSIIGDQPGDYPMPGKDGTASQWKPSNINPNDVTKLLDYNASINSTGVSDVLSAANKARQIYGAGSTLAKLLSGTQSSQKTTQPSNAFNLSQLASLLGNQQVSVPQAQFGGLYQTNKNPFTFTSAGQTTAAPGTYDVSGASMANALRKA